MSIVARHGPAAVPLLMDLLSDDPGTERDAPRWKVQQQASLTLSLIYSESPHCGRTYCDGDAPERVAGVKKGWLRVIASKAEMKTLSAAALLERFKNESVFWRQLEIGRALAAAADRAAVASLESWLGHDDRHLRANAAFVIGRLGDPRGFDTIAAILVDRASRSPGQGIPGGSDGRAIGPLMDQLGRDDPSRRVLAILALETLKARQALPRLRELLHDQRPSSFGDRTSVADAARRAIAVMSQIP